MWKDDAIAKNIRKIADLLQEDSPKNYREMVFVGMVSDGTVGVTAEFTTQDDDKIYPHHFFDYDDKLKAELLDFWRTFSSHGDHWKAVRVCIGNEGDFDIQFEYNDPYRWEED